MGTLVNTLVDFAVPAGGLDNVTDVDAGAKLGIAVIAADASNGKWFYSINNGNTWSAMGSVASNKARLLAADSATRIYFQPNANFYGNLDSTYYRTISAIGFRVWDQTRGTNGALDGINLIGGSAAFSVNQDNASLMVKWLPPAGTPAYELIWIDANNEYPVSSPRDINNAGVVVGYVRYPFLDGTVGDSAFRWSPPGILEELDELSGTWIDLENNGEPVTGWRTSSAEGINASGQIVGTAVFAPAGQQPPADAWTRTFVFEDTASGPVFKLLPTDPMTAGHYLGRTINEAGDVLGAVQQAGGEESLFFWTPQAEALVTVFLSGHNFAFCYGQLGSAHFAAHCNATDTFKVFSYAVDEVTGGFTWSEDAELATPYNVGRMSDDGLLPFTVRTVDGPTIRYSVAVYDAETGETVQCAPCNTFGVSSVNNVGDVVFDDGDGDLKLYRDSVGARRVYDLLNADAKTLFSPSQLNGYNALVNDQGWVTGKIWGSGTRGYVLVPIER